MRTPENEDLVLTYSHNVIEHLGLKLYQNKPTRVIAELVSNSWDADSERAWVEMDMETARRWVAVHDTGQGMTRVDLQKKYLVIGAPKRSNPKELSPQGRRLMGRKGIGKLAPFGIATSVEIVTAAPRGEGNIDVNWIHLNLADIKAISAISGLSHYNPVIKYSGQNLGNLLKFPDETGQIELFCHRITSQKGTGTLVLLQDLTLKRAIPHSALIESLGRRFTATLDKDFDVWVAGEEVSSENALPSFEYRIPESGILEATVGEHKVRYWVGFVEHASWPADQAGVGIYSHGKICQDRPFTFGRKGKEIFTRYMYAVVEADWLDEQDEDLISTDRTSVNWDAPGAADLLNWGSQQVGSWVTGFSKWRATREKSRNQNRIAQGIRTGILPAITQSEQEQVADLVSEITPSLGKDEDAKDRVADAVASAWLQEPMRVLIQQLWAEMGSEKMSIPGTFTVLIEKLVKHSVPESLNLAVVFAQRAFALSKLYELVHNGKEIDLQRLIEQFPWIIEPDTAYLTADQTLRTVIKKAEEKGLIPSGRRENVAGVPDRNKPDFVFLSSPENERLVVVELKNPQEDVTLENRQQLADYLTYLEAHYPNADRQGYLVGRIPATLQIRRDDMRAVPWTEVMQRSKGRHVIFLAAMLSTAGTAHDVRVGKVREFGGEDVWAMLRGMADCNEPLRQLFADYDNTGKQ